MIARPDPYLLTPIVRNCGAVELFIRDPQGSHGGFMRQPNLKRAMDLAATFVE